MKRKWLITGAAIFAVITLISGIVWWQGKYSVPNETNNGETPVSSQNMSIAPVITTGGSDVPAQTGTNKLQANIIISSPGPQDMVSLPITITGEARVFENQFNYRIRDAGGNILMEGSGYANSPDAGTYGPYHLTISSLPVFKGTTLKLEIFDHSAKDGSEIDLVSVPVRVNMTNTMAVKAYFTGKSSPAGQECTAVYPVERYIAKTQSTARAALEELLKGPYAVERANGLQTNINEGVTIQKLTITNGVARVDFNNKLQEAVGGSCRVTAIRAQITQTLKQFPSVQEVVISVNGKTDDILQP